MRGNILTFDAATGEGVISGADGKRYSFTASDVRSGPRVAAGLQVDFVAGTDGSAQEVFTLEPLATTSSSRSFDLGRVLQRAFTVIGKNWAIFLGASAILIGIPSVLAAWGQATLVTGVGFFGYSGSAYLVGLAGSLLNLAGNYVLQGMVMKAAINTFNGKSTLLGEAFDVGVKMLFPLLGLGILAGLGIGFGFVLLIVPGIILMVMWSAAAPVLVAEKRGVFDSLARSRDLTRGYRWPIFGLLVIYLVLSWIIGVVVAGILFATSGALAGGGFPLWITRISAPLINVLSGIVVAAGASSLYYELRLLKGGPAADELASIFD